MSFATSSQNLASQGSQIALQLLPLQKAGRIHHGYIPTSQERQSKTGVERENHLGPGHIRLHRQCQEVHLPTFPERDMLQSHLEVRPCLCSEDSRSTLRSKAWVVHGNPSTCRSPKVHRKKIDSPIKNDHLLPKPAKKHTNKGEHM